MGKIEYIIWTLLALMMPVMTLHSQEQDSLHRHYSLDRSVVTSERRASPVKGLMTGNIMLETSDLDWLPQILGTPDILKTIQLMPGVTASGEMDSGVYVRGADPGQVSVLFDGAKIYFPAHLLNFYSVFNSDHIASATVLKSGISPMYGGGTSGIIDVEAPDELFGTIKGKVNLGIISSQATVSAPIGEKSAIRISGRGTYVNWLLNNLNFMRNQAQPAYGFHDANATWIFKPDEDNSVKFNVYYSQDGLSLKMGGYSLDGSLDWSNSAASLVWNRRFDNDVKMNNTVSFSRYDNYVRMYRDKIMVGMPSGIMDFAYKGSISMPFGQSSLLAGADYVFHRTKVQTPMVSGLYSSGIPAAPVRYGTHESAVFAEYSKWFSFPLRVSLGLRCGGAVTAGVFYGGLEPRLSASYDFSNGMRLRASAMRQMQYVNTVSVSGMGLPTDFLVPVTDAIRPQSSSSVSLGFSHSFAGNRYEYSLEPYLAALDGVLEYDGEMFDLLGGHYDAEEHVISGTGMNYGVEFMLKKNSGKVSGWISYTLSRAVRSFPDIMGGESFFSKHDRLHNMSCVLNYRPSSVLTLSAVFVYGSGTPYTPPSGLYMIGETIVQEYGRHNSARMPDYHRLDISATYDFPKRGRLGHSLNLSIYNVYARNNPLFRDIRPEYDENKPTELNLKLVGVSLYTLLPSISYNLTF